ncbi:endonuclease domain-containing protein [Streptomyces sp. NPDC090073]|uniref:endonuclease domain-containing protein n=1 Tax=Streptomyces sp. NPDC090073 TaxID=3365936 RepID=UPI0037F1B9D0
MTDEDAVKTCIDCKETKPETAFHRDGSRGRNPRCAECRAAVRRIKGRSGEKRTPERQLEMSLWQYYRITLEQFRELNEVQAGVCVICGQPPQAGKRLSVDHCHETGVVRALLCTRCNLNVGVYETHGSAVAAYLSIYGRGNPRVKNAGFARGCTPPSRRKPRRPSQ